MIPAIDMPFPLLFFASEIIPNISAKTAQTRQIEFLKKMVITADMPSTSEAIANPGLTELFFGING